MIDRFLDRFSEGHIAPKTVRFFRWAVYIFLLYNTFVLSLPIIEMLWGEHSLILPLRFPNTWSYNLFMLLHGKGQEGTHWILLVTQVVGILLYLRPKWTTVSSILVFFSTVLLYNRVYLYVLGGNYLIHLLLFFLMFINENVTKESRLGEVRILVSNLFFWAVRAQVIMVYLVSGLYKLAGESWRNGTAVAIITQIDEFTLPWFKASLSKVGWLMAIANYVTLIYLCLFPVLVWVKKFKRPILLFGVLYHLGLGVVVGVMDFSLIMIISYIVFLDDTIVERKVPLEKATFPT